MISAEQGTHPRITVELEHIGEGWDGDYDPEDSNDDALLRFTVLKNDEPVDDASYCTQLPDSLSKNQQLQVATFILDWVYEPLVAGHSIKKLCERLSWIDKDGKV